MSTDLKDIMLFYIQIVVLSKCYLGILWNKPPPFSEIATLTPPLFRTFTISTTEYESLKDYYYEILRSTVKTAFKI